MTQENESSAKRNTGSPKEKGKIKSLRGRERSLTVKVKEHREERRGIKLVLPNNLHDIFGKKEKKKKIHKTTRNLIITLITCIHTYCIVCISIIN
jgi:hypothetical protein